MFHPVFIDPSRHVLWFRPSSFPQSSRGLSQPRRREKILVIEDAADILEVIEYNLRREGYRVHGYLDGEEGLKGAKKENPDLVLLDLMLPGMDGLAVCRELKRDSQPRTTSNPRIQPRPQTKPTNSTAV